MRIRSDLKITRGLSYRCFTRAALPSTCKPPRKSRDAKRCITAWRRRRTRNHDPIYATRHVCDRANSKQELKGT